ncbi:hypothetical protein [Peterkaempfera griseoplana]|uniref:hypothetical protein n=1 Tax=Peterkaempfera griseoplana TaxID=66896 RepID=UPI0006E42DC6|nr:hypothetical protein [Peterkaempfera griseoplana]
MTEWDWEYMPDPEQVVGGLSPGIRAQVDLLARRLADAAAVRYLGEPPAEEPGVSPLLDHAEGRLIVWYLEHRRLFQVLVVRVQCWPDHGAV